MPSTTSSYAASTTSFDTASTLSVASSTTIAPLKTSPVRDYAAAFGALQTQYGTSGFIPTPVIGERKKSDSSSATEEAKKSGPSSLRKIFKRSKSSDKKSPAPAVSSQTTTATGASSQSDRGKPSPSPRMEMNSRNMGPAFSRLGAL